MTLKKSLLTKIEAFLADKKKSDGGYAPVDPSEVEALYAIVRDLIEAKYQADPDGDHPVEVILTDRTRYERPLVMPVFYPFEGQNHTYTYDRLQERARQHARLAAAYADAAKRDFESLAAFVHDAVEQQRPLVVQNLTYRPAPKLKEGVKLDVEWLTPEAAKVYRKENKKNPCPTDPLARTRWAEKVAARLTEAWGLRVEVSMCRIVFEGLKVHLYLPAPNLTLEFNA